MYTLCCISYLSAQTYYYGVTETFHENGYTYQCDVQSSMRVRLYNKENKITVMKSENENENNLVSKKSKISSKTVKNLIKFNLATAMRIGEICSLNKDIDIDKEKNRNLKRGVETEISASSSKIKVFVIPTDEEIVLTEDVIAVLNGKYKDFRNSVNELIMQWKGV